MEMLANYTILSCISILIKDMFCQEILNLWNDSQPQLGFIYANSHLKSRFHMIYI